MEVIQHPELLRASMADLKELMDISVQTFVQTYGHLNTEENMRNYLEENFSEAALLRQLQETGTRFYLLRSGDKTAGYIKLNTGPAQTELKDKNALEIERIYVQKSFQGRGLGRYMAERTLELAREARVDFVWLGVWEYNTNAIGFYTQMGFVEFGRHIFRLGDDDQTDLMLKIEIKN